MKNLTWIVILFGVAVLSATYLRFPCGKQDGSGRQNKLSFTSNVVDTPLERLRMAWEMKR